MLKPEQELNYFERRQIEKINNGQAKLQCRRE
jgi:hypothetical protein